MLIRPATSADAAPIAEIYAPIVRETAISFEEEPPDAAEMARRIDEVTATHPWLVADDGRDIAGYAYATALRSRAAYRRSTECTVYVHPEYRGRGIGARLYQSLFERLVADGFHAVFAGIALPNEASIALHRACRFEPVGIYREVGFKFGRWIDTSWWQRRL